MSKLKVIYSGEDESSVVKSAIEAEIRRLEIGLNKTDKEIKKFEEKYSVTSRVFLERLSAEDLKGGDRDYIQWSGELKIRERILDALKKLKDIEYVAN